MENQTIKDTDISGIKDNNSKVRIVGKVLSFDEKTGIFEIEDEGSKLTCMAEPSSYGEIPNGLVLVTGRAISADSSFEIRADSVQSINMTEYNNYKKYLKIRNNLLNNGS